MIDVCSLKVLALRTKSGYSIQHCDQMTNRPGKLMPTNFSVTLNFEHPECGLNLARTGGHQELLSPFEWQKVFRPIRFQVRVALPLGLATVESWHNGNR